jgi:acetolactate synthase-1/3 small subunit
MASLNQSTRTVVALVQDRAGVLSRICGLFRRQGFNIASLTVGASELEGLSRMTFVVEGQEEVVRLVAAKLDRLIEVVEVQDITDEDHVYREMVLVKIGANKDKRGEVLQLTNLYSVKTVDVGSNQITIETTGDTKEIDSLLEILKPYGILEVIRTGRVAILKSENQKEK